MVFRFRNKKYIWRPSETLQGILMLVMILLMTIYVGE